VKRSAGPGSAGLALDKLTSVTAPAADASLVRVVVADDQALIRGGIVMVLGASQQIQVVGQATNGAEAVAVAGELRPDVVIMDLKMPGMDGIEATKVLVENTTGGDDVMKVLVLTTFNDDESVFGALRAGASGFLVKDEAPIHLIDAVLAIAAGNSWIDPSVTGQVIKAISASPRVGVGAGGRLAALTPREREVLVLMAHGMSNGDITRELFLSEATVRTHVSRILMKTGSRDRTEAVVLAYQSRLVQPG
jgi:DNA-binding NarL/FixJ family response regulator